MYVGRPPQELLTGTTQEHSAVGPSGRGLLILAVSVRGTCAADAFKPERACVTQQRAITLRLLGKIVAQRCHLNSLARDAPHVRNPSMTSCFCSLSSIHAFLFSAQQTPHEPATHYAVQFHSRYRYMQKKYFTHRTDHDLDHLGLLSLLLADAVQDP